MKHPPELAINLAHFAAKGALVAGLELMVRKRPKRRDKETACKISEDHLGFSVLGHQCLERPIAKKRAIPDIPWTKLVADPQ